LAVAAADLVKDQKIAAIDEERKKAADANKERREQNAELSKINNEIAESKMTAEQKLADWRAQEKVATKEIGELEKLGAARTNEDTSMLIELKKAQLDLQAKIKNAVVETAAAESKITEEQLARQQNRESNDLRASLASPLTRYRNDMLGPVRSQDDFAQASDAVIEEEIRRYSALLSRLRDIIQNPSTAADTATGDLTRNIAISQVERNRQAAQAELNSRRSYQSQSFGQALRNYQGDPLNFDRLYSAANGTQKAADRTNELLEKINRGLPVIVMNPPAPRG